MRTIRRTYAAIRAAAGAERLAGFRQAQGGNVATILALSLIPIVAVVGAAVDYSRASTASAQLRAATDAATLAAAQKIGGSYNHGDRQQAARDALQANLQPSALVGTMNLVVTDITVNGSPGVRVSSTARVDTTFMRLAGYNDMTVHATSESLSSISSNVEIALVLDTTGSMVNDMPAMKTAARNFADALFSRSNGSNVKMSVVPYVATVNVGPSLNPAMFDVNGDSYVNGYSLRNKWIASMTSCDPWAGQTSSSSSSSGGTPDPDPGLPIGNDRTGSLERPVYDPLGQAKRFAAEMFGVKGAAADVTANTVPPITTTPYTPGAPYVTDGTVAQIPVGFEATTRCWLKNPDRISNFDLFRRIPNARWKGCVEARPDPYDIQDTAPSSANASTLFVPYFAPDETVSTNGVTTPFSNDYLSDYNTAYAANLGAPPGWYMNNYEPYNFFNILKYDGNNRATIQETGNGVTKGPNAFCPDQMLPLTTNRSAVINRIDTLSYWPGGGTISSEGLMWGWRSISPNAPFALGAPYGTANNRKYIVLMTDGLNSLVENRPNSSWTALSDYTAYGYLAWGRMGPNTFSTATDYLNGRMRAACANAKAQNITIYTVLFRETDAATVSLMQDCASTPANALRAADSAQLAAAFQSISGDLQKLRLVR